MYEYIQGKINDLTPAYIVIEAGGIGYNINISLNSFAKLQGRESCKLFLHQVVREDAHVLYGFEGIAERELFRKLITVSGVGANTARMILSSMAPGEVQQAILSADVEKLKGIKGIGAKSAQRIIVDLKDKIGEVTDEMQMIPVAGNTLKNEALSALENLGFSKKPVDKVLTKLMSQDSDIDVENLIKRALKML